MKRQERDIVGRNIGTISKATLWNFWETWWSAYGFFRTHKFHLELKWDGSFIYASKVFYSRGIHLSWRHIILNNQQLPAVLFPYYFVLLNLNAFFLWCFITFRIHNHAKRYTSFWSSALRLREYDKPEREKQRDLCFCGASWCECVRFCW